MAVKRRALAERRKAVGHSQETLAYLLGVERSTVVRWEAGATEPLPWLRPKLAHALAVSVDELHQLLTMSNGYGVRTPGLLTVEDPLVDTFTWEDDLDYAYALFLRQAFAEAKPRVERSLLRAKGRITQIKSTAPAPGRAFFGVGPVTIAIPLRAGVAERERVLIAAEDSATVDQLDVVLAGHALTSTRGTITPQTTEPPAGDTIVVCGPKSAPVGAWLLDRDPCLGMTEDGGQWSILDRIAGQRHASPGDGPDHPSRDIAYFARHVLDGRIVLHIAGIHAAGSLGMVHYLTRHLVELFSTFGDEPFSLAATCAYDGLTITDSALALGPYRW